MVGASFTMTAAALVGRTQKTITTNGNAQVSTAQSQFGGASALFDGTGDYLIVPASSSFNFGTSPFTIELWFRRIADASGVIDVIIGNRNEGFGSGNFVLYTYSSSVEFDYRNDLVANNTLTTAISNNTWYHFAIVRNGTSLTLYKDGAVGQAKTIGSTETFGSSSIDLSIGCNTQGTFPLNGYIDELRISNTARYTTTFTPPTTAFVNDSNTLLLIHADGTNASTVFTDDASVIITPAASSVNEGSSITFNVTTAGATDQTLYYTVTNAGDFGTSSGSFSLTSNAGSFSVTPTADTTTEGAETFTVSVRTESISGTIIATSSAVTINDTSVTPTPSYAVAAAGGATSVNEGSSLTFNVTGSNITNGTYYFTVNTNAGDFATSSGSFTITSNAGSFSVTPTADTTTEGAETFTVSVRTVSTSGTVVATSSSITINDTSVASITTPSGVEFQRASSEKIRVWNHSSNVRAKVSVASYWFKLASSPTGDEAILVATYTSDGNAPILCELTGGNIRHYSHSGSNFYDLQQAPPSAFTSGTWNHIVTKNNFSNSGRSQVWLNGVRLYDTAALNHTNTFGVGNLDTNSNGYGLGGHPTVAARLWNGCIAQVYWYGGDIDIDTNIAKFYNNGVVDMGASGTSTGLPTPHIYHKGATQATFDDVLGSLGGSSVTVTGTLSACT
jgi:hypothetical protein